MLGLLVDLRVVDPIRPGANDLTTHEISACQVPLVTGDHKIAVTIYR